MPMETAVGARKSRTRRRGKKVPLYAAVDLGTNNCRLLIARRDGETFRVVDSHSQDVRLGEGLAATGRLSEAAMARANTSFAAIKRKLRNHGVGHIRCIATEACRKAENGAEFIAKAREEHGLSFRIIGAKEEARLAAIGCHNLLEPDAELVMVLDIGGGSTEIAFIDLRELQDRSLANLVKSVPIKAWGSFPLGVVTLTETHQELGEEAVYDAMLKQSLEVLGKWKAGKAFSEKMEAANAYMVGTSGTVTCLAGIHLKLERYRRDRVDGMWLDRADAFSVIRQLEEAGREGRIAMPTVGVSRADLMMSGCAILEAACTIWPTGRLRVADRGLREGLIISMMHGGGRRSKRGGRRRGRGKRNAGQAPVAAKTGTPSDE